MGVNPKINNIYSSYECSEYPLVLISDAGIFMKPDSLNEMVGLMKSDVGIVQQLPFIADRKGWPATLEKVSSYNYLPDSNKTRLEYLPSVHFERKVNYNLI